MSDEKTMQVFICGKDSRPRTKIQLEITTESFEKYKEMAKESDYTPREIMTNMLQNWADGTQAS